MTARFPSSSFKDADGVTSCFGNVPLLFFNLWIQQRPAATPDEFSALLATAADRAATCKHPVGGVVREDWLPSNWQELAREAGLAPMMPLTGMEATQLLPARYPSGDLEIRRVADISTARDLATANALAYEMSPADFDCLFNMHMWQTDSYGYVGYVDGQPVAAAAALPVAGTVYIAMVATLPGMRGKGYAEDVMRHAVTEGRRHMGYALTTLHATDMGLPVYRRMGYATGTRFMLIGPPH